MKSFRIVKQKSESAPVIEIRQRPVRSSLIGKGVRVKESQKDMWLGAVKSVDADGTLYVSPATMHEGRLLVDWRGSYKVSPDCANRLHDIHVASKKMDSWEEQTRIKSRRGNQTAVKDSDGNIVDYKNVTINGYLSTFEHVTQADRDGDYVRGHAFDKSVGKFSSNAVMLMDHTNTVDMLAGSFSEVKTDKSGLYVVGKVSNAPELRKVRFLVAEGHLKSLSMGGLFLYGHDGKAIEEVELWEGSLVPIPANQDASFSVRSFDSVVAAKSLKRHLDKTGGEIRGV